MIIILKVHMQIMNVKYIQSVQFFFVNFRQTGTKKADKNHLTFVLRSKLRPVYHLITNFFDTSIFKMATYITEIQRVGLKLY